MYLITLVNFVKNPFMEILELLTERLNLIAGTADIFRAGIDDRQLIGEKLEAIVPDSWVPEHYEQHVLDFFADLLAKHPDSRGWTLWYMVLRDEVKRERLIIGNAGFKGLPDSGGTVEIGYSVLPEYQRAGYASEAVAGLIAWAFSHPQVERVIAETYPELTPSKRVLEKNGFGYIGNGSEERVIRYELTRKNYEKIWRDI